MVGLPHRKESTNMRFCISLILILRILIQHCIFLVLVELLFIRTTISHQFKNFSKFFFIFLLDLFGNLRTIETPLASRTWSIIDHIKSQFTASFEIKDLGNLHYFWTPESILISQRHYVLNMLFKFGMKNCKSISTPLERNVKLHHESGTVCDMTRFREVVGSLYLSITWPDLSYPVDLIGKFMSKPMSDHL